MADVPGLARHPRVFAMLRALDSAEVSARLCRVAEGPELLALLSRTTAEDLGKTLARLRPEQLHGVTRSALVPFLTHPVREVRLWATRTAASLGPGSLDGHARRVP